FYIDSLYSVIYGEKYCILRKLRVPFYLSLCSYCLGSLGSFVLGLFCTNSGKMVGNIPNT
ncbi:MAG TPA: hypothetical protein VN414_09565, partial [Methanosarcina sp.]|nr:hypothetical protein [Methanosarcina sp.]